MQVMELLYFHTESSCAVNVKCVQREPVTVTLYLLTRFSVEGFQYLLSFCWTENKTRSCGWMKHCMQCILNQALKNSYFTALSIV